MLIIIYRKFRCSQKIRYMQETKILKSMVSLYQCLQRML
nr:MAG TPA: hypothetical protein [Bacteriophage sp.]